MKICLYSPYMPQHTGGGEKYLLDVALSLSKRHQVYIAIPVQYAGDPTIVKKYENFLNTSLENISFIHSPLGTNAHIFKKLWWTKQFDVLYYVTDGSLFFSLAKKNILHIQFPLRIDKSSWLEQKKLSNWQVKNTNSLFTKKIVEANWPVKIDMVHNPLIDEIEIKQAIKNIKKEKVILNVGRFFRQLHSKRQDILIDCFRQLMTAYPIKMKGWKLVLIGPVEDQGYLTQLKHKKVGLPVEFYHDLDRKKLLKWYGKASIYWHAAGFGVDPKKNPEKVEHFGIATAEAMMAGCVPIVHGKGGQIEVTGEKLKDWWWMNQDECVEKTLKAITRKKLRKTYQELAQKQAKIFSRDIFEKKLFKMVET